MKWKYKAVDIRFAYTDDLEQQLNALGGEGWELVSFEEDKSASKGHVVNCIFKRPAALEHPAGVWAVPVEKERPSFVWTGDDSGKLRMAEQWGAAIRSWLVELTGQNWQVGGMMAMDEDGRDGDVTFLCQYPPARIDTPPIRFSKLFELAAGPAAERLAGQLASQVADQWRKHYPS